MAAELAKTTALLAATNEQLRDSGQRAKALRSSAAAKILLAAEQQEKQLQVGGQRGSWQSVLPARPPACPPARLPACLQVGVSQLACHARQKVAVLVRRQGGAAPLHR